MNGWIRLHRSVMEHWVWLSDKHFKRWCELIFLASWEDKTLDYGNKQVKIKRGQLATSYRKLQYRWNTSASGVQNFLKMLQKSKMIKFRSHNKEMTIVTILNYDKYQSEKFWEDSDGEEREETSLSETDSNPQNVEPVCETSQNGMAQRQEQTELNNKEKNKTSISLCEREKFFFEKAKGEQIFIEAVAKNHSLSIEETLEMLEKFFGYITTLNRSHNDEDDFKDHFYKWLSRKIETTRQYGTDRQKATGRSPAQDKYAARRGTDVGDKKSTDYGGSF